MTYLIKDHIELILQKLNLRLVPCSAFQPLHIEYSRIQGKQIRFLWKGTVSEYLFKVYAFTSPLSYLKYLKIKLLSLINLQSKLNLTSKIYINIIPTDFLVYLQKFNYSIQISAYEGNKKAFVLYLRCIDNKSNYEKDLYLKFRLDENHFSWNACIQSSTSNMLQSYGSHFLIPDCFLLANNKFSSLTTVSSQDKQRFFHRRHYSIMAQKLYELYSLKADINVVGHFIDLTTVDDHLSHLENLLATSPKLLTLYIKLSKYIVDSRSLAIKTYFSHGDLTPWNIYIQNNNFGLFDFDDSRVRPVLYDLIYYNLQCYLFGVISRKCVIANLIEISTNSLFLNFSAFSSSEFLPVYLNFYLFLDQLIARHQIAQANKSKSIYLLGNSIYDTLEILNQLNLKLLWI